MKWLDAFEQRLSSERTGEFLFWLLVVAALLIFSGLGLRSPWPPDEPRFADVAREMVVTGQWFFPARGEEFYPDKPPIFMWAIALCYYLIGNIKIAALLPNALCSLVSLVAVFDISKRIWGMRIARHATLLLLITPQFLIQAKFAQIDAMVACWITLGCYGLLRHFFCGPHWRWYFLGWGFMGLGIITKGVGFLPLLMLLPIAIYHFTQQRLTGSWRWRALLGPIVMLAVVACWLVPMYLIVSQNGSPEYLAYRDNILFKQTGERYVDPWHHFKPWHYFISSVVPAFWLPLSVLLLTQLKTVLQQIKQDPRIAVLFGWVILVIFFFSLSPAKRGVYILPALPMFCIALAAAWPDLSLNRASRWFLRALLTLIITVFTALTYFAAIHHDKLVDKLDNYTQSFQLLDSLAIIFAIIVGAICLACVVLWRKSLWVKYGSAVAIICVTVSWLVYPLAEPLRTPQNVMLTAAAEVDGGELAILDLKEQHLLFSPIPLTHFSYFTGNAEQFRNAWLWINEAPNRYIMAPDNMHFECFDPADGKSLGIAHREHWLLFSAKDAAKSCPAPAKVIRYRSPASDINE